MGAHETLSTDHSALRVSCPTNFESTVGVSAVQSPLESLNNWNLTPLPAFKANLSQFSDVDSSHVIDGPVQDFVPNGMTKIIHLFLTRSRAGYDLSLDQFAELLSKFDKEPELFLTPDVNSINFVHSVMGQCEFHKSSDGAPFETSTEFMTAISAKTGLEVQNVTSRGGNCFFHAFWVAYYGSQPDRDDITGLRHRVACRIFSKWSDCDFRSCITLNEYYAEFVQPSTNKFDLARFLCEVADENQGNYQLECDGLLLELVAEIFKCVVVIVCVKTEGSLSRMVMGATSSACDQLSVYVAWNGRERSAHYFAFLGNAGARVIKWAEFSPPPMIGSNVDVERTREREFFSRQGILIFITLQSLTTEWTGVLSRIFGKGQKTRPSQPSALLKIRSLRQVCWARLLARPFLQSLSLFHSIVTLNFLSKSL